MTARRAWIPVAALLSAVYLATVAPDVTFWDAGEFIAAAHSLGIPHPPGTPLFILLLHAWALPWSDATYSLATNLFSALCTVIAAGLSATLVARWTQSELDREFGFVAGIAAAVCAGTMSTAWSNATETEVYAASLALAVVTLYAADRAGRNDDRRSRALVAYCFGLAAPLHISALVAAPAAIVLASTVSTFGRVDRIRAAFLLAAAVIVMAIGTLSPMFAGASVLLIAAAFVLATRANWDVRRTVAEFGWLIVPAILGATPLLFLLIRSGLDPGVNQGNPSTIHRFLDVVARRQYDLAPLWPRRAPLWIQLGNWFEYADWQSALSLGPTVIPTVQRIAASIAFGGLAIVGATAHRRADRRSWRAMLILLASGSLGVVLYLNLRASPSFGWGILPANVEREARERDYFFVLGFWALGLWAGLGAVALARRWRLSLAVGLAVAELTIVLNWRAVSRRGAPESQLPREIARGLLTWLPEKSVLFVAGDNDTYPLWYAQEVLRLRRDITVVTLPLLDATWYGDEIRRRTPALLAPGSTGDPARAIAAAARTVSRPVLASLSLTLADRARLHGCWTVIGVAALDTGNGVGCVDRQPANDRMGVDTIQTARWVKTTSGRIGFEPIRPAIDPVNEYFARLLRCPSQLLDSARKTGRGISLDSTCNH